MPFILKRTDESLRVVFCTGLFASVVQCVYLREYLSVFMGNELVLGFVFAIWLFSTAAGSMFGNISGKWRGPWSETALIISGLAGLLGIRMSRLFFEPGTAIPPTAIIIIILVTEITTSFFGGYIFGTLANAARGKSNVYCAENVGGIAGSALVYLLTLVGTANSYLFVFAIIPTLFILKKKPMVVAVLVVGSIMLVGFDKKTISCKYAGEVSGVHYTREGEAVFVSHGEDTTLLLNNNVYRSNVDEGTLEQAVHIPMGHRRDVNRALVIFDRGYRKEFEKYKRLQIDVIETLPFVASGGSIITAPEQYRPAERYGFIILGAGFPENVAVNRFYTVSFFNTIKSLLVPGGIFSFTLQFSENYMNMQERELYGTILNTLRRSFRYVRVFPGIGYTFIASSEPLNDKDTTLVETQYLEPFILSAMTAARIEDANTIVGTVGVNTTARPTALLFALRSWMVRYGMSARMLGVVLVVMFLTVVVFLPKSIGVLSVATSGFSVGVYSIAVMMLYQAVYGTLYSQVALLLMALTAGFVLGSKIKRFPFSDISIGVYLFLTLILLSSISQPAQTLFFIANLSAGVISGAQFVTRENISIGILNAADLFGGVFGMALTTTILIPLYGIVPVAFFILAMKVMVSGIIILNNNKS